MKEDAADAQSYGGQVEDTEPPFKFLIDRVEETYQCKNDTRKIRNCVVELSHPGSNLIVLFTPFCACSDWTPITLLPFW